MTTLDEITQKFLTDLKTRNFSPRTLEVYEHRLGLFVSFLKLARKSNDEENFGKEEILGFGRYVLGLKARRTETLLSEETRGQIFSCVRKFLSWGHEEGFFISDLSPLLKREVSSKKLPKKVLTEEEIGRIFEVCDTRTFWGQRDRTMLEVLYGTGIRRSELAFLGVYDLRFDKAQIFIRQGKGKKDRVLPLAPYLLEYLGKYVSRTRPVLFSRSPLRMKEDTQALFISSYGRRFTPAGLNSWLKRIMEKCGPFESGAKVSLHGFRHAFATHLLKNGANLVYIRKLLGHERIRTTEIYTRVYPAELKRIIAEKHPRNLDESANENITPPGEKWILPPLPGGWLKHRRKKAGKNENQGV